MLDNFELPNETIDKIYDDGFHQSVAETGKIVGRIPRAINAALSPLDCWILKREFNVAETKKSLEEKLASSDPDKIVPPEPYVAVPAFQSISYCMTSHELHDLYANLLAKAMFLDTKDQVHPSFVEIIKQFSPNDAVIFKKVAEYKLVPSARLSIILKQGLHIVGQAPLEKKSMDIICPIYVDGIPNNLVSISIDNLKRLGLIAFEDFCIADGSQYEFVKSSNDYAEMLKAFESLKGTENEPERINVERSCFHLSPLGKSFKQICIDPL